MKIDRIKINNFRGFGEELDLTLDSSLNLFIGDNGSGKTAILEALTVAIGSFFLGINGQDSRGISKKDIHIASHEHSEEYIFPVTVHAEGTIFGTKVEPWTRSRAGIDNNTTRKEASSIMKIAQDIDSRVRKGESVDLPLLIYYATGRLFDVASEPEENAKEIAERPISSRFRAYKRCLEAKSTFKAFEKWFKGKELAGSRKNGSDLNLNIVKKAVVGGLPDCTDIYYEFDPDKPQGIKIVLEDGRTLPFNLLSDGTRNFFAIIADMAYKCITLNPHFGENALAETAGVVLIDELDLHLHPAWQRLIIKVLRTTFPNIQFFVTTHSPFVIQEIAQGKVVILKGNKLHKIVEGVNLSIEDIAEGLQDVVNPQWSIPRQEMFEIAGQYYKAVKEGKATPAMKTELDKAMKPFANDTAFYAIMEQERIIRENKQTNNEAS